MTKNETKRTRLFRRSPLRSGAAPVLLLSALTVGCASFRQGRDIPATPQRPTFSSDTSTTAEGTLELESGLVLDPGDRLGTPSTLKLGLDPRSEAFLGFQPLIVQDQVGSTESGVGDLVLGYRRRFLEADDGHPSAAWLAAFKAPTADEDEGLGTGDTDLFGALALSWPGATWSSTAYAQLGWLGTFTGDSAWQPALAVATARPIEGPLSGYGEIAWVSTPEFDDEQLFTTLGLTWTQAGGRIYDAGFVVGLNEDAPDLQLVIGTTLNLGRIFR